MPRTAPPTAPATTPRPGRADDASARLATFAPRLLAWWDVDGRKDLPWQQHRTAYRVWVSEIMLQQTQVATVLPYYARFMARFPDVASLAAAAIDDVLHLWTGLGYYARGRNLHRAARVVMERHGGEVPTHPAALVELPGIGRSTAHAIHALAADGRSPILDGNVKRVLTRWLGIDGWPGEAAIEARLWELAAALLPATRMADYTQAIMDLGATRCTRSRPQCGACPLRDDCVALATQRTASLPVARPKRAMPERATRMWVILSPLGLLLQKRPASGLWGGLWSFPESPIEVAGDGSDGVRHDGGADEATRLAKPEYGLAAVLEQVGLGSPASGLPRNVEPLPAFTHQFTHFRLAIQPMLVRLPPATLPPAGVSEPTPCMWYREDAHQVGLSAVVTRVLDVVRPLLAGKPTTNENDGDRR